jgi:ADP-dependent NAD(P)H-hydrate dehydratase / NAD(P)H-hydrate epimerase
MKLVSVEEMQSIEREADASGLSYSIMMENAGIGLGARVLEAYGHLAEPSALGLVGSGNNGGDTLVALAWLLERGWKATAYLVRARQPGDPLVARVIQAGGEVVDPQAKPKSGFERLKRLIHGHAVLLDGVLGTGVQLPLKPELAEVLGAVRGLLQEMVSPPQVVAVDCPSGIDASSGEASAEAIPADLTITIAAVKTGLLSFPAFPLIGELHVVGIGPLDGLQTWDSIDRFVVDREWVSQVLPARPLDAHKGTFGTALVVAGSTNYTGAALLAGQAAYRAGAGLVTMAVPGPLHHALAGHFPEATWVLLPHDIGVIARTAVELVRENLQRATAMLVGPGFGLEDTTRDFLAKLFGATGSSTRAARMGFAYPELAKTAEIDQPGQPLPALVIDADGLKLLARIPGWQASLPAETVLTPHPGELSVMTEIDKAEIQADRLGIAARLAAEWGHVLVLKGALTVIAAPDGRLAVIPVASPALARAGTGDVLAGLIVGLRAQGVNAFEAAAAGAWIHAQAGLYAAGVMGSTATVLAGDVLNNVVHVMAEVNKWLRMG